MILGVSYVKWLAKLFALWRIWAHDAHMSTQTIQPAAVSLAGYRARMNIKATVNALMRSRGMIAEQLAPEVSINPATLRRRLAKGDFRPEELADLADYFNVSIDDLFTGIGGKLTPPECAARDSNPEPADYVPIRHLHAVA